MDQPGTYLPYTDTYLSRVNDIEECRSRCTIQNQYNCRSFNYNAFRKECFLSSDDSISLPDGLHSDRDFIFSERGGCNSGMMGPPGIKGERANSKSKSSISLACAIYLFYCTWSFQNYFILRFVFLFCFFFVCFSLFPCFYDMYSGMKQQK